MGYLNIEHVFCSEPAFHAANRPLHRKKVPPMCRPILRSVFLMLFLIGAACGDDQSTGGPPVEVPVSYLLQPKDEITLRSLQVKEVADKTLRIDQAGEVIVPLAGRIHVAGNTITQAEGVLVEKLKRFYVEPDVVLDITTLHTEQISVIGSVGSPGLHQMKAQATLLDALSLSGGIRGDAGAVVMVTRQAAYGRIPHPSAQTSSSGESVAEISLKSLMDARDPRENIPVQPYDVITVPPAQVVYVVGNVKHAGGFPLNGKPDVSILQALALAEGMDARASPERARIIRRGTGAEQQIAVNLKKVLAGKAEDLTLRPNDILFVPNSAAKAITMRSVEAAIQVATGFIILH